MKNNTKEYLSFRFCTFAADGEKSKLKTTRSIGNQTPETNHNKLKTKSGVEIQHTLEILVLKSAVVTRRWWRCGGRRRDWQRRWW